MCGIHSIHIHCIHKSHTYNNRIHTHILTHTRIWPKYSIPFRGNLSLLIRIPHYRTWNWQLSEISFIVDSSNNFVCESKCLLKSTWCCYLAYLDFCSRVFVAAFSSVYSIRHCLFGFTVSHHLASAIRSRSIAIHYNGL